MDTKLKTCHVRKHSTEGRVKDTKQKIQIFVFDCACGAGGRFNTRAARDREAAKHQ